jgi:hypothetical protein
MHADCGAGSYGASNKTAGACIAGDAMSLHFRPVQDVVSDIDYTWS